LVGNTDTYITILSNTDIDTDVSITNTEKYRTHTSVVAG